MKSFFQVVRKWIPTLRTDTADNIVFDIIVASSDAICNIEYVR